MGESKGSNRVATYIAYLVPLRGDLGEAMVVFIETNYILYCNLFYICN